MILLKSAVLVILTLNMASDQLVRYDNYAIHVLKCFTVELVMTLAFHLKHGQGKM